MHRAIVFITLFVYCLLELSIKSDGDERIASSLESAFDAKRVLRTEDFTIDQAGPTRRGGAVTLGVLGGIHQVAAVDEEAAGGTPPGLGASLHVCAWL